MWSQSTHESGVNWSTMSTEYPNIQVKTFPKEVLTAIRQANDELLKENAAKDEFAAKVLKSQQDYLNKVRQWTNMSDKAYLDSTAN